MITYHCPHCRERLQVADARAGHAYVCTLCGQSTMVPGERPAPAPAPEPPPTQTPLPAHDHTGPPLAASSPSGQPAVSPARVVGGLLLFAGVCAVGYFFLIFDTSVAVEPVTFMGETIAPGGRVNNIGLMQDRQNGILVGGLLVIVGLILSLVKTSRES